MVGTATEPGPRTRQPASKASTATPHLTVGGAPADYAGKAIAVKIPMDISATTTTLHPQGTRTRAPGRRFGRRRSPERRGVGHRSGATGTGVYT